MFYGECPICLKKFTFRNEATLQEAEGATFNCPRSGCLLIVDEWKILDFHGHLHKGDSRWPADGKGSGCLTN